MKQDVNVKMCPKTPAAELSTDETKLNKQTESLEDILQDLDEEMAKNPRAFIIF